MIVSNGTLTHGVCMEGDYGDALGGEQNLLQAPLPPRRRRPRPRAPLVERGRDTIYFLVVVHSEAVAGVHFCGSRSVSLL